jgi:hypothetical protein
MLQTTVAAPMVVAVAQLEISKQITRKKSSFHLASLLIVERQSTCPSLPATLHPLHFTSLDCSLFTLRAGKKEIPN